MKRFTLSPAGAISAAGRVAIEPITPGQAGFVSHYTPGAALNTADAGGNKPPAPTGFNRTAGAATTFPAGVALSPDGRFLYVACNGDNSLAVIDTSSLTVVRQVAVGYFPYDVTLSADGRWAFVSNWGITEYTFAKPTYGADGTLTSHRPDRGQPARRASSCRRPTPADRRRRPRRSRSWRCPAATAPARRSCDRFTWASRSTP